MNLPRNTLMQDKVINECWYAVKVFWNKVFEMEAEFREAGIETYVPVENVLLKGEDHMKAARRLATPDDTRDDSRYLREGPRIYYKEPILPSLLFIHTDGYGVKLAVEMLQGNEDRGARGFVYGTAEKWSSPAVIPDSEMRIFRMVLASARKEVSVINNLSAFKPGTRVRVKSGPFEGAEGYIKRIKKQRQLVVAIEGIVAVAVADVPPELLEPIAPADTDTGKPAEMPVAGKPAES